MRFDELKLSEPVLRAVHDEGYETPTPIQAQAIPHVLSGSDLLGCAQTGTGKTAAFALPILCRLGTTPVLAKEPIPALARHAAHHDRRHSGDTRYFAPRRVTRVLVLTPTRELAVQIGESFTTYGKFTGNRCGLVFGGVGQGNQERMLRAGVDVLVATPGRLLDLMNQGFVDLSGVEVFVLDEADRMLDMGFIHDIRKVIAKVPEKRQTLLFSATMPMVIKRLADGILRNPVHVAVAPVSSTAERVEQKVFHVEKMKKSALLLDLLDRDTAIERVLVFTRTKHGADRVSRTLTREGVSSEAIHGNKSQGQRQRALELFKKGRTRVLVATDIAARGLDIDNLTHVINFDLPNEPESYVHRIGRTGRAGASGIALSFCSGEERGFLRDIERVIGKKVPVGQTPAMLERIESPRVEDEDERPERGRPGRPGASAGPAARPQRPNATHHTKPAASGGHGGHATTGVRAERPTPPARTEQHEPRKTAAPAPKQHAASHHASNHHASSQAAPAHRPMLPLTDPIVVKPKSPPFHYEEPEVRPEPRREEPEERPMRPKHAARFGDAPKFERRKTGHAGAKKPAFGAKPGGFQKANANPARGSGHPMKPHSAGHAHEGKPHAKPFGKPGPGPGRTGPGPFKKGDGAPRRDAATGHFGGRSGERTSDRPATGGGFRPAGKGGFKGGPKPGFKKGGFKDGFGGGGGNDRPMPGFRRAAQGPAKQSGGGWKKARR